MNRTRRHKTEMMRRAALKFLGALLLAATILLAFAQAEGLLTVTGHDLANEYSAADFYPPEWRE